MYARSRDQDSVIKDELTLFGFVPVLLWPLITVSNKLSLQNQLRNPRASDPE